MRDSLQQILKSLPSSVRQAGLYAYGMLPLSITKSKVFRETSSFLSDSQWWDRAKLEEYQNVRLAELIRHSYQNVPYYRRWFDERGLRPEDVPNISSLGQLPLLIKSDIDERKNDFISKIHTANKLEPAHTGGSTGSPMHFWYEKGVTEAKEQAFFERMWRWHGYKGGRDKCVVIAGSSRLGERIEYNPAIKTLFLWNPVITREKVAKYIEVIGRFRPKVFRGYPSLIHALAHFVNGHGLKVDWPFLKVIFCQSEKIYDFQRNEIALAFKCKVVDHYGHKEMLALLQKCEVNDEYHVIMEYGIVEVVSSNGLPLSPREKIGELVATGFNNYAFPLIRYKTGDWVELSQVQTPCPCGRSYPRIKDVIGRSGDFVLTPSGNLISPTLIIFATDDIRHYLDVQIIQTDPTTLVIEIVPDQYYEPGEGERLASRVVDRIGEPMKTYISIVDKIERPLSHKRLFVKSEIAKEYLSTFRNL